jgi:DNA-directed RNA polymerase subunit M/transcription elongation factor TFIIS
MVEKGTLPIHLPPTVSPTTTTSVEHSFSLSTEEAAPFPPKTLSSSSWQCYTLEEASALLSSALATTLATAKVGASGSVEDRLGPACPEEENMLTQDRGENKQDSLNVSLPDYWLQSWSTLRSFLETEFSCPKCHNCQITLYSPQKNVMAHSFILFCGQCYYQYKFSSSPTMLVPSEKKQKKEVNVLFGVACLASGIRKSQVNDLLQSFGHSVVNQQPWARLEALLSRSVHAVWTEVEKNNIAKSWKSCGKLAEKQRMLWERFSFWSHSMGLGPPGAIAQWWALEPIWNIFWFAIIYRSEV